MSPRQSSLSRARLPPPAIMTEPIPPATTTNPSLGQDLRLKPIQEPSTADVASLERNMSLLGEAALTESRHVSVSTKSSQPLVIPPSPIPRLLRAFTPSLKPTPASGS
jgi:hypothetical protein